MADYRRVYDSHHLQADCQVPGSAAEPYTLGSRVRAAFTLFTYKVCKAPLAIQKNRPRRQRARLMRRNTETDRHGRCERTELTRPPVSQTWFRNDRSIIVALSDAIVVTVPVHGTVLQLIEHVSRLLWQP